VNRRLPLATLILSASLAAADDPMEKGRALYDAARKAAGAEHAVHDISYERSTQLESQGRKVKVQSSVQVVLPDASRTEVTVPGGTTVFVFDGKSVRNVTNGQTLPQQAADLQRRELARTFALFGPEPESGTVRYRGQEEVAGKTVDVIELFDVGDTPLRLYLDRDTHDVIRRVYVGDAPDGTMAQVEETLSDYQAVDGVRLPHSIRTKRNGKAGPSSTIANVVINQGLSKADITK
jgi:outer membrane lipoprotein-sorting protein